MHSLKAYTPQQLKQFYEALLLPRIIEEKMLVYLRQGKISKWFSGMGQEAISVGSTLAMDPEEYMLTMHRNLGVFTTRNVPLKRLFAQFQGKMEGFTQGRDRSFHFGSNEQFIAGMISHLGPQLGVADGIALAEKIKGTNKVCLAFTGDGGASEGDFHEALNVAAVWQLPVIFLIENNQWGLSTPSSEQFRCEQFIDKGIGYGMKAMQVDGNDLLEVYEAVSKIRSEIAQSPQPYILECKTFRIRGHEEASGTKYYPEGIIDEWKEKDPIQRFESRLMAEGLIDEAYVAGLRERFLNEVSEAFAEAQALPVIVADKKAMLDDLFAKQSTNKSISSKPGPEREMRLVDAVSDGLKVAMREHDELILMGQDIAEYGGVFKVTEGMVEAFGKERVRNTPLCESAIVGAALGLSIKGMKAMVEMQFADFVTCGFNQIVNNLAKIHWRWGQHADVVIRMPTGAGVGAGPFHSQSTEAWFYHVPGLKICYPAFPVDAKGLLLASFNDPNPVLFFEHKFLYRSLTGMVPEGYYETPLGQAAVVQEGNDLSIITYGLGVHWALEAVKEFPGASIEIIDLKTLAPLDFESIKNSVMKTNRALVLHEDNLCGGIGADIAARISEELFEYLDAPVKRCASLDTPIPFASELEQAFLAKSELNSHIAFMLEY